MITKVYNKLLEHEGEENAISAPDLVKAVGLNSERELRHCIHAIRLGDYEKVILSGNRGYFVGKKDEVRACVKRILNQAFNNLKIGRAIQRRAGMDGQGIIKGEEIEWIESLVQECKEAQNG